MTNTLQLLELQFSTPSSLYNLENGSSFNLGNSVLASIPSSSSTELQESNCTLPRLKSKYNALKSLIGKEVVVLSGVKLESLHQTTQWVRANLLSSAYYLFHNTPTLLKAFDESYLST